MTIAGFMKVRNEIVREGNLYRALANLEAVCDGGVICDDGSTDGTRQHLEAWTATRPHWLLMRDPAQGITRELAVKQRMLELVHSQSALGARPQWIWWLDGDEAVEQPEDLRRWIQAQTISPNVDGYKFHYTQLWRTQHWARTDDGFDTGHFVKLWRYHPDLSFTAATGTHLQQFPRQIRFAHCPVAPFEVIHWGNFGKSLQWKAHQYADGTGGVDRHLAFGHSMDKSLATGVGFDQAHWSRPNPTYRAVSYPAVPQPQPQPYTLDEIRRIRRMGSMRVLDRTFCVIVPAFNRADTLPRALDSLLTQRHRDWVAFVLDDGSTDNTPEVMRAYQDKDPRIFYCRYPENRGGVAMNEIGMALACETAEWWSRLGSDDWWGPGKLEADARALTGREAVFGPFTVWKNGKADHVCAGAWGSAQGTPSERLRRGEFLASWANVAVRTHLLARVRDRYGCFCDPRLRNMEDYLVNVRIARMAEWVWRDGDPADAFWNCLEGVGAPADASASANSQVTARDNVLTRQLIAAEASP